MKYCIQLKLAKHFDLCMIYFLYWLDLYRSEKYLLERFFSIEHHVLSSTRYVIFHSSTYFQQR